MLSLVSSHVCVAVETVISAGAERCTNNQGSLHTFFRQSLASFRHCDERSARGAWQAKLAGLCCVGPIGKVLYHLYQRHATI